MRQIIQGNAQQIMDVAPLRMHTIPNRFHERQPADINISQLRALLDLNRNHGVSLSDLADHIGLTPPSTSKLIEGLGACKLVSRGAYRGDCMFQGLEPLKKAFLWLLKIL